jgi:phenylalanine-4-hydroxylase
LPPSAVDLVVLDPDHPGFRDAAYRARRNAIAQLALEHTLGAPVAEVAYTEEEHAVWRNVQEHLAPLHDRYACREYKEGFAASGIATTRIPPMESVNARLAAATGFRLEPVGGLVTAGQFMRVLEGGTFLSTQYMRHCSVPLYTPEPDVVHELVGHAPLLHDARVAHTNRLFGRATRARIEAGDEAGVQALERLYWFSLEFGVARRGPALEVYGAGLLSSFGELGEFARRSELVPFDIPRMCREPYDPTTYQARLFVATSVGDALDALDAWLLA